MGKIKSRDFSVDLIKCLAIVGVLFIHCCNYTFPLMSAAWITNVFFGTMLRSAVPLFLMCSGALMLNPEKNISVCDIFTKYLPRLVAAMLFWSVLYKVFHLATEGMLNGTAFLRSIKEVLFFNQEFHMYYMHMILIVYLFLPVTRAVTANSSQKGLLYALILWFVFGILYPSFRDSAFVSQFGGITRQYSINMTYASIGYGVLGYYLKKYPLNKPVSVICLAAGFLIVFFGTVLSSVRAGALAERYLEGMSVGVCLSAIGIFGISRYINGCGFLTKAVIYLSNASFCIYLVHIFFVEMLKPYLSYLGFLPQAAAVPVFVLVTLALSTAVYAIFSRIPVVRRYLL